MIQQRTLGLQRQLSSRINCSRRFANAANTRQQQRPAPRHLMSIADLKPEELTSLVESTLATRNSIRSGGKLPGGLSTSLDGKTIAMMFSKRSTRTRVSTEAAVKHMGGHAMFLGKDDIQLGVNETLYDTGRVISSMCAGIVARVGQHSDIEGLAEASSSPVINALSDMFHPLQAIADIATIYEYLPKSGSSAYKIAWVGDANNVLYDLLLACSKMGINMSIATPSMHPVNDYVLRVALECAGKSGSSIEITNVPEEAVKGADAIVTDTWVSMGQEEEKAERLKQFHGFRVTNGLAAKGNAKHGWKFLHCLPRKPEEVSDEVFYGRDSLVFAEAENRLYAAISVIDAFIVRKGQI